MPAGSTWSRSRSAYSAASAWTVELTTPSASSAKSPHGKNNEMPPAPASNGCSQPKRPAPKWAAPIPSHPKSHNHCAEVLGRAGAGASVSAVPMSSAFFGQASLGPARKLALPSGLYLRYSHNYEQVSKKGPRGHPTKGGRDPHVAARMPAPAMIAKRRRTVGLTAIRACLILIS
jgi:hypothetical protein